MLLRSLTKHLKEQNWLAVALDFVIVVFGVFVGMQVNEWNERRIESKLELSYIERLKDDIQRSMSHNDHVTNRRMLQMAQDVNVVIDSLQRCSLAEEQKDSFAKGLYGLGQFETVYLDSTAIDEMKSIGRWAVVSNHDVRESVEKIYRQIDYQYRVQPQFTMLIGPALTYVRQKVRFDVSEPATATVESMTFSKAHLEFEQLCGDSRFLASVSTVQSVMLQLIEWNQRVTQLMAESITLLEAEQRRKEDR